MTAAGKLPIITPILFLIGTAIYVTLLNVPAFPIMQVEMNSTYVTWYESSQQYKYLTIYGVQTITLSKFWEVTIIIKNKGLIPTKIVDITVNKEPVGKAVTCLATKSANSSVYDLYKIGIKPGETVKILVLIPFLSGKYTHGSLIEIRVYMQGRELTTMVMLP